MPYRIEYSPEAEEHLRTLTARQQATVLDAVEEQPLHQPLAPWEPRIGNLRVYYDVEEEPEPLVSVRAVGVKLRNRVRIGKEVIEL